MDPLQNQKLVQDVQSAQKATNKAAGYFEESQLTYKKEMITVFEKMSLFSAGIISLSITFVGALIPDNSTLLAENILGVPVHVLLYISWASLTLNLIFGLAVRWADSMYLFFNAQGYWHKRRKKHEELNLQLNESYPNLVFSEDTSRENEIVIAKRNIETLSSTLIPRTKKKETFYFKVTKNIQKSATLTFALGILFLLIFVIKVTNGLIYK